MHILEPLDNGELNSIFNEQAKEIINYFIKKSIFSQPEIKPGQKLLPVHIPKEHIEQWFSQALDIEGVGAGSYPVDLLCKNNGIKWGADVKMLTAKCDKNGCLINGDSGETSLGQNFKTVGRDLDTLFANRNFQEIRDRWVGLLKEKLQKPIKEHELEKIYYFILLRGKNKFYICGLKVNFNNFDSSQVNTDRSSNDSVYLNNFIDDKYGNVKIYKAKKRMELRLHPLGLQKDNMLIEFDYSLTDHELDMLDYIRNGGDLNNFGLRKSKNIFN